MQGSYEDRLSITLFVFHVTYIMISLILIYVSRLKGYYSNDDITRIAVLSFIPLLVVGVCYLVLSWNKTRKWLRIALALLLVLISVLPIYTIWAMWHWAV